MKRYKLLLIGIVSLVIKTQAQTTNTFTKEGDSITTNYNKNVPTKEVEAIATDRPDQTESPYLVPSGMFQIESGTWIENNKDRDTRTINTAYNTSLIKFGVSDRFELRLIVEYLGNHEYKKDSLIRSIEGMNSFAIGTKIFICNERGIIPKTSLIAHLQLPYAGYKEYRPSHLAPRFRFTMQHTLSDRFSLSYNLGAEWDGDSENATAIYTLACSASLIGDLGMYLESYGFMTENSDEKNKFNGTFTHDHRVDGGFTYLFRKNLQLDISAGFGVSDIAPDYLLSAGISWRFPR